MNIFDSIVYRLEYDVRHIPVPYTGFSYVENFIVEKIQNETREQICSFAIRVDDASHYLKNEECSSSQYDNRTAVLLSYADRYRIDFDFTISIAQKADNGTYMISSRRSRISKCFTVFILG